MLGDIIKFVGGSTVLLVMIAWLIRSIVTQYLSKDIEAFKSQLRVQALEHEIRFARLHEKVAETIAKTYGKLQRIFDCLSRYVNIEQSSNDPLRTRYREELHQAYEDFQKYFRPRRIYLPHETAERIWEAACKLQDVEWTFSVPLSAQPLDQGEAHAALMDAYKELQKRARPLLQLLEDEFRRLLGVKDEQMPSAG